MTILSQDNRHNKNSGVYVVGLSPNDLWAFAGFLAVLPFLYVGLFINSAAKFIAKHMIVCMIVYLLISIVVGLVIYPKGRPLRACGVISTVLTVSPIPLSLVLYVVPFVVLEPGFNSIFDFFIVLGLILAATMLVIKIAKITNDTYTHLLLSICHLIFATVFIIICMGTENELITAENLRILYGL